MKVIDSNFNEIEDVDSYYSNIYSSIVEYIKNKIKDEKIRAAIMEEIDDIIIQETNGEEYAIKTPNGSISKNKMSSSTAALRANMQISVENKDLKIIPGIALRPNFSIHDLVHELLHTISSNRHNYLSDEGIVFTKIGTRIDYFDKNLKYYVKEDNPSSDGLNEGITELLTSYITNEFTGQYPSQVVIAELLTKSNDKLLNAYFSKDLDELEKFYEDLEKRQSIITRDDLRNLKSINEDEDKIAKIIAGAIEYNKSYNCEIDLDNLLGYLDNYDMLDNGTWSDLVSSVSKENNSFTN